MRLGSACVRATTWALASLLAALPAVAAAAQPPAALSAALLRDSGIAYCARRSGLPNAAFIGKAFDLRRVTLDGGERMVVATGADACVCAAQNCPTLVLLARKDGGYRVVLSDWSIESHLRSDGTAVLTSHDSAAVSDRSYYRWNGLTYAVVRSDRVDARSGAVKPMSLPVSFATGASSATLRGKIAQGFGDTYTLRASAGQTMTLALRAPAGGRLTLYRADAPVAHAGARWSGKLPASGEYRIDVDAAGETPAPYVLTISIR